MMNIKKPNLIIYVKPTGLQIRGPKFKTAQLDFPDTIIRFQTVLDASQYQKVCNDFFKENDLRRYNLLIIAAPSLVFTKDSVDAVNNAAFISQIPLTAPEFSLLTTTKKSITSVFAVNKQLFLPIAQAAQNSGAKLVAILPAQAYDLKNGADTTENLVQALLVHYRSAEYANLLKVVTT